MGFSKICGFLCRGLRISENLEIRISGDSGDFYPQRQRIFENLGIFILGIGNFFETWGFLLPEILPNGAVSHQKIHESLSLNF